MTARTHWNANEGGRVDVLAADARARRRQEVADEADDAEVEGLEAIGLRRAQAFHREHAVDARFARVELQHALDARFDDRARRLREVALAQDLLRELDRPRELALLDGVEDRVAMREVLVERANADAGDLGDARRGRGLRPFTFQNPNGRLDNGRNRLLRARLLRLFTVRRLSWRPFLKT